MKRMYFKIGIILFFLLCANFVIAQENCIDLSGNWKFKLDKADRGVSEKWFKQALTDEIKLPGALQNQGYGNEVTARTPWVTQEGNKGNWFTHPMYEGFRQDGKVCYINNFQPKKHYVGVAWYQKRVYIPADCSVADLELLLERVHWKSTLWINEQLVDSCYSLLAPHRYSISRFVQPGKENVVTLRVDNREVIKVGANAHSWGDQTMTTWNGVVGSMSIIVRPKVFVKDLQIYPDVASKNVRVVATLSSSGFEKEAIELTYHVKSYNTKREHQTKSESVLVTPDKVEKKVEFQISLGDGMLLWDEYTPNLYRLYLTLKSGKTTAEYDFSFGMREITKSGNRFYVNGRETYFRGNVLCGTFPETGYASMEKSDWKRIFALYKYYGLNHVRFHSWTPPMAAFAAADEVGLYLFAETNVWTSVKSDIQHSFLAMEGRRALQEYGNHPSFVMMGMGNEHAAKAEITNTLLKEWKKDKRRLYTGLSSSPSSITGEFEFIVAGQVRSNKGWPPRPKSSYFFNHRPASDFIFHDPVVFSVPLLSHEVGQQCSYPSLDQKTKYTGSQMAGYIDVARSQLKERGMLDLWPKFVEASGKLQVLFYKNEIESYMRTPLHTGYQLLQIEDFPGQGGALVGVLDYFYDSKGYVTPQEFRSFNGERVLLAEMKQFVWKNSDVFEAKALITNWGAGEIVQPVIQYSIEDEQGVSLLKTVFTPEVVKRGDATFLGSVSLPLYDLKHPTKLCLKAKVVGTDLINKWDFWVYPSVLPKLREKEVMIVKEWTKENAKAVLNGKDMILQLDENQVKGDMPYAFLPIYWTQFDHMGNSQSMGILCEPKHPLFQFFPTDFHTNWQWWELLRCAKPIIFDEFAMKNAWPKDFIPSVQLIDGWKTNRKTGVLAEARLGKGRIVITSMNLTDSLDSRVVARQFRYSLQKYMKSSSFAPLCTVTESQIEALLRLQGRAVKKRFVKCVTTNGSGGSGKLDAMIDDNPLSFWQSGNDVKKQPVESIVLELKSDVSVGGIVYTPVQGKKEGQIRGYQVWLSKDGKDWGIPLVKGEFSQNGGKQEIDLFYFHNTRFIKLDILSCWNSSCAAVAELELLVE